MGLREGDLKDLVEKTISIDEFESKIDPNAIVVAFFVDDEEPAEDLSQFIESGMYDLLDTEVSPGTDERGKYAVFIEFLRNDEFTEKLDNILEGIESLTLNSKWDFTYPHSHGKALPVSNENITNYVNLEPKKEIKDVKEFFKPSLLNFLEYDGKTLKVGRNGYTKTFEVIALGGENLLFESFKLGSNPYNFSNTSLHECKKIRGLLGNNWDVNRVNDYFIIANNTDSRLLIVK